MYILVVDDSAVARLLLNAIFVEAGHQVLQAADGYQALELLQRHKPDIVTMDVHMPGLNGYETIGRILELYTVPIIILTSSANAKAATTAIQALAKHGQQLQARQHYLPPEGFHLVCHTLNKISLLPACPTDLNIPSADLLFNSLARHMARKVIAIQLSGMGQDGAEGCGAIHQAGGTCIVQDPATALIDSMPKAALRISQTDLSLSPEKIAAFINNLTRTARLASSSKESE
jgi:chemotaxis response regulator CheB